MRELIPLVLAAIAPSQTPNPSRTPAPGDLTPAAGAARTLSIRPQTGGGWGLVYDLGDKTYARLLPGTTIREVAPSLGGGLPDLTLQIDALDYHPIRTRPVRSPDGKRIAYVLMARQRAAAHGEVAVTDGDGGNAKLLTSNGLHNGDPVWFPDSRRLLYQRQRLVDGKVVREAVVHDLDSDHVEPFLAPRVLLRTPPLFLAADRLLALCTRQTDSGVKRALMLLDPEVKGEPELVIDVDDTIEELAMATSGRVFVRARERLALLDVGARKVIDSWPLAELANPERQLAITAMQVRPDGAAVAVSFTYTGTRRGSGPYPGEDQAAVIALDTPTDHGVTRLELGAGVRLRRWCSGDEIERARLKN